MLWLDINTSCSLQFKFIPAVVTGESGHIAAALGAFIEAAGDGAAFNGVFEVVTLGVVFNDVTLVYSHWLAITPLGAVTAGLAFHFWVFAAGVFAGGAVADHGYSFRPIVSAMASSASAVRSAWSEYLLSLASTMR